MSRLLLSFVRKSRFGSEREKVEERCKRSLVGTACLASSFSLVRFSNHKEVAALKDPFELAKMPGYRPLSKKEDQAGDNLATASYPFLMEAIVNPYAPLEVLLSKKPKSLRTKAAPSRWLGRFVEYLSSFCLLMSLSDGSYLPLFFKVIKVFSLPLIILSSIEFLDLFRFHTYFYGNNGFGAIVCILEFEDGIVIHMLVERRYPLSKDLLQRMLDLGLEVERESSVALDLIRFIKQQIDEE
ncbi:hypothetical protein Tco_0427305 [Tanacetum coccineum]